MNQQEITLDQVLSQQREAKREIVNVDEPTAKLVIFELQGEWFAFQGEKIREILSQVDVFFVPGCPTSLQGVINVRGDIESVISLHELLQLPESVDISSSSYLLGSGAGMSSTIRVDKVVDVVDVLLSNIHQPPTTVPQHLREIVSGIVQFNEKTVTVLDLDRIFADYSHGLG
ncbi:MAG: chemotaxis protein CheW [Proteobacteria bacterium]|jgi:purine-binding chemotaxis protein CheW|nr:chemotaxis protein CheW [Desulfocapsa sp.]MBU3945862.1 chemotaxis protein CheW [Pseudomonadota bacterium]MCG2745613.1 chemotaxis protein CheW [Desulfobacteraceae bacterium]MBU3982791.1 chemotaxis protein CheW [Pseudomonadota bacterium]MBU4027709.1 chemotaxis protein CheW [Pseudomonadota bacterium]